MKVGNKMKNINPHQQSNWIVCLIIIFQPRKALLEQLSTVLGGADEKLPDTLFLVNTQEWQGQVIICL